MRKGGAIFGARGRQIGVRLGGSDPDGDRISQVPAMRRIISALVLATCLAIVGRTVPAARAQAGGVVVSFHNQLKIPVIVQGTTVINGMRKRGMALLVLPGKTVSDNNVPANSIRFYDVYDANRPILQYIRNAPLPVTQDDVDLVIRSLQGNVVVRKVEP